MIERGLARGAVVVMVTVACVSCAADVALDDGVSPAETDVAQGHASAMTGDSRPSSIDVHDSIAMGTRIDCENPSAREEAAFTTTIYGTDWPNIDLASYGSTQVPPSGRGVIVADFNGDGAPDIVAPNTTYASKMLVNDGAGAFAEAPGGDLATMDLPNWNGGTAADVDADGDFDVVLYGIEGHVALGINDGSGAFAVTPMPDWDVWEDDPRPVVPCGRAASFADFDLDGDLDFFYGRSGGNAHPISGGPFACDSLLLSSNGDGTFSPTNGVFPESVEGAPNAQTVQDTRVVAATALDVNGDVWPDLRLVSDAGDLDILLINEGGTFKQFVQTGNDIRVAGMGVAVGDINEDLIPDFMITGIAELPTLVSAFDAGDPHLLWLDAAAALGVVPDASRGQVYAWGGQFQDVDNDTYLDILASFGTIPTPLIRDEPDEVFLGSSSGVFTRAGQAMGVDNPGSIRGGLWVDLNGDGWLDTVRREIHGGVIVDIAQCAEAAWLGVRLHDPAVHNRFGVGARVVLDIGERRLVRWVEAGSSSFASGGPPDLHFGLGGVAVVDNLQVQWPDGAVVDYGRVPTKRRVEVRR